MKIKIKIIISTICVACVFVSCTYRNINTDKYSMQTVAFVDTVIQNKMRWDVHFSYVVDNESYNIIFTRSRIPLPKGTPTPIRYQKSNPNNSVIDKDFPIPINDSVEIYYTYRVGKGVHYVLRKRKQ